MRGIGHRGHHSTNFRVGAPLHSLVFQDEVGPHTATCKILDPLIPFGAIGMRVKVTRPIVANLLEKLHQPKSRLRVRRPEAKILVEAPDELVIQVNMKQLASIPRLRYRVGHVQTHHVLMRHLWINPH